jgi:hypothetical protein
MRWYEEAVSSRVAAPFSAHAASASCFRLINGSTACRAATAGQSGRRAFQVGVAGLPDSARSGASPACARQARPAPWLVRGVSGVSGDFAQQDLEKKKLPSPLLAASGRGSRPEQTPPKSPKPPYGLFSGRVSGSSSSVVLFPARGQGSLRGQVRAPRKRTFEAG